MKEIKKIIKLSNKIDNKGFFKIADKIDGSLPKKQIITDSMSRKPQALACGMN